MASSVKLGSFGEEVLPNKIPNLVSLVSGAFQSLKGDTDMFELFSFVVDYFAPLL